MGKRKIIIAIDGYSSTGKSSFAKEIAARLGYIYVDTGALYRAVTYHALRNGLIGADCTIDTGKLRAALPGLRLTFRPNETSGKSETYLNGTNVEQPIRTMEVSGKVSHISALPFVREFIDGILRNFGKDKGVVMDGRDIGTAVFPEAELKLFMTADPQIRAERRIRELRAKGEPVDPEEVLKNLKERDYIDTHRESDPLVRADDAVLLDNSRMTIGEQLDWLDELLRERFGIRLPARPEECGQREGTAERQNGSSAPSDKR